jgi:hypothetical protein
MPRIRRNCGDESICAARRLSICQCDLDITKNFKALDDCAMPDVLSHVREKPTSCDPRAIIEEKPRPNKIIICLHQMVKLLLVEQNLLSIPTGRFSEWKNCTKDAKDKVSDL